MKRLLLAGLLALAVAPARAESDAYGSLVGMAVSASADRGPEAGTIPERAKAPEESASAGAPEASRAAAAKVPETAAPSPATAAGRSARRAKRDDGEAAVSLSSIAMSPQPQRTWIRFFSSLLPPMRRVEAFEVAASTAPRKARPAPPPAATAASAAGSAQGLRELVAATTAP